jgi:glycosyltransferase involved in cell wall biosynthesis
MNTWNSERFVAEAIESVLGQDFEDLELIIVNDASTNATRQIIECCAKQDP